MDLKKLGFQLPENIRFDEETLTDTYGKLMAEPLERGFGTTIGNSLRRVLLSSLEGAAVTAVKITGALHEFSSLEGIKEDVVDIILNIKKLRFVMHGEGVKRASIRVKGPHEIAGENIETDGTVEVINPGQYIATVSRGVVFEAELYIRKGKGYVPSELNEEEGLPVGAIAVDSLFSPIKKVNFRVENARVGRSTDYDRLIMEIWTDGTMNPERAVSQAAGVIKELMEYFVLEVEEEEAETASQFANSEDEPVFNENLLKNVDELELSVRAHNCLKNANIKSIAELVQKTEHDMLRTKNFGRKSLNEIKEILNSMGLRFGMRIDFDALKKYQQEGGLDAA
jgi:DNA-directed RNA polymerase subunit alpha